MKKYYLFVLFCIASVSILKGQKTDRAAWFSVEVSGKVTSNLELELEEEIRFFRDVTEIDRISTSLGAAYTITDFLKAGAGYSWILDHKVKKDVYENRHRYYFYLRGRARLGGFKIDLREKFQSTYYDPAFDDERYSPANELKSRLQVSRNFKDAGLEPYANVEMYYQLNDPEGNKIDQMRYTAGIEIDLTKSLILDPFFRIETDINIPEPETFYIGGVTLKWEIN